MNANVKPTDLALQRRLSDVVAEYEHKLAAIPEAVKAFQRAGDALKTASTIAGVYGDVRIDTGSIYESDLKTCLLKSAWKHVYQGLNIDYLASPDDKRKWQMALEKPEPFTIDNIRGTFGRFLIDPRASMLRALAEVFCDLDPAYKSHDKVKIGVAGLPKRVILQSVGYYSCSYGMEKLRAMLNALAAFQGQPLPEYKEFEELSNLNSAIRPRAGTVIIRGLTIKKFLNGNAHVMFDKATLRDINKALAEFYGDVLPDTTGEKPEKPQSGTEVAKDLQYYPTPQKLVDGMLEGLSLEGKAVLEPSCGCGRILDGLRKRGANAFGVEVDFARAAQARAKGHPVHHANFLETVPTGEFDLVVMNPPFYGKHYAKHVRHAFDFLKPGGTLIAILPITAKEHGLLDDLIPKPKYHWDRCSAWSDLPVGSFSESGTNINTTVLRIRKGE